MDLSAYTAYIPALSADWIILGVLALFLTFDALRAGPSRVTALAIALPIALTLSNAVPQTAFLGAFVAQSAPAVQTGAFIAIALGLYIAIYRIADTGSDSLNALQALIAGLASALVCVCVLLQLPSDTIPWTFGDLVASLFGEAYRLYWFIGAYFALAISRA